MTLSPGERQWPTLESYNHARGKGPEEHDTHRDLENSSNGDVVAGEAVENKGDADFGDEYEDDILDRRDDEEL